MCTLGDLLLDVIVRLEGRIDSDTDTYGRTTVHAGGQAANVAAWTKELGRDARLICKRSTDLAGTLVAGELELRGIDVAGPTAETGTGTVVSITSPTRGRTMLSDRGVSPTLAPDDLDPSWFSDCTDLYVTGYSLTTSPMREAALEAARHARRAGACLALDVSSTAAVRAGGLDDFHAAAAELAPDLVLATERERAEIGVVEATTQIIKRGAGGVVLIEDDTQTELEAVAADVVDTTGAGDALAAGFLVGGIDLGLMAAARCVTRPGAMP